MAGTNAQTWNSYKFFQPVPTPPSGVVGMANELISRIGIEGYESWCNLAIADSDQWPEIAVKMADKLEMTKVEAQADIHAWANKPEHYKMNGVH